MVEAIAAGKPKPGYPNAGGVRAVMPDGELRACQRGSGSAFYEGTQMRSAMRALRRNRNSRTLKPNA